MRTIFFAFMLAGLWVLAQVFAGHYEGRYWPVVTEVAITRVEPETDTSVRIWGEFYKARGYCAFNNINFYLGSPQAGAQANLKFIEGTKLRGEGWEEFGPWVVQLTETQLRDNSYAVVMHRCHPFWLTETLFYKG